MEPGDLPPPLRGADGGFTADSIHRRLGVVLDETLAHDHDGVIPPAARQELLALKADTAAVNPPAALPRLHDAAEPEWRAHLAPLVVATWDSAPWFLVELGFYSAIRGILAGHGVTADPFQSQKRAALDGSAGAYAASVAPLSTCPADTDDALLALLLRSLWGNRADLSLHTVAALAGGTSGSDSADASLLLVDDTADVPALLRAAHGATVHIVLDNCGLELLSDFVLVDGLLRGGWAAAVTLHLKDRPVFVSDAQPKDVHEHLGWLRHRGGADAGLSVRLSDAITSGALVLAPHPFWTSPLPAWEMPADLRSSLGGAALAIFKGDANYRRLLGDRHWPHTTPFSDVVAYLPCPALSLRTNKAGLIVGVPPAVEAAAAAAAPETWLTSGRYGVAQLKR